MNAEPQTQHKWLQKLVGEWDAESEMSAGPDQPTEKSKGTERIRSLGGLWILSEGESDMGGTTWTHQITLGFDPHRQRFVGSFVSSNMAHFWPYEGQLDSTGKRLELDSEGPDMSGAEGKLAPYRDIVELVDDDHWILRGNAKGEDGSWQEFMHTDYRRRK